MTVPSSFFECYDRKPTLWSPQSRSTQRFLIPTSKLPPILWRETKNIIFGDALSPAKKQDVNCRVGDQEPGLIAFDLSHSGGASMRPTETIAYVVSDEPTRVRSLKQFFSSHNIGVTSFGSAAGLVAAEYMATARDGRIACLIIDFDSPDLSGLDIQRKLAGSQAPPIIFVTDHSDAIGGVCAMKNGAIDFMVEPLDSSQLMAAVELAFSIDRRNRTERAERAALLACWNSLTPREAEVFHHTTAGLLNKQAAWELGIAENTYQVHRGRVMRKMKAGSLADLVRMSTKLEPIFREMRNEGSYAQFQSSIPEEPAAMGSTQNHPYPFQRSRTDISVTEAQ